MRISFGMKTWDQESDYLTLFERANAQMYTMKRE